MKAKDWTAGPVDAVTETPRSVDNCAGDCVSVLVAASAAARDGKMMRADTITLPGLASTFTCWGGTLRAAARLAPNPAKSKALTSPEMVNSSVITGASLPPGGRGGGGEGGGVLGGGDGGGGEGGGGEGGGEGGEGERGGEGGGGAGLEPS